MYIVYKLTNMKNNKVYIGYSSKTVDQRFYLHTKSAFNINSREYNLKLKRAIRKYGPDSFDLQTVFVTWSLQYAKEVEYELILEYNSMDDMYGYNMCNGGQGGDIKSAEQKALLSERLRNDNPSKRPEVREKISNAVKKLHDSGHYRKSEKWQRSMAKNKQRFKENNPTHYHTEASRKAQGESLRRYYENNPERLKQLSEMRMGNTIYNDLSDEQKKILSKARSDARKSEVFKCSICDRVIKTSGNFTKHLRAHKIPEDEIEKYKAADRV